MATSSETINIDLKIPTRWEDLTEKQLRYLFGLLAQGLSADEVKTYCLFRWSGLKVLHRYANGYAIEFGKQEFIILAAQMVELLPFVAWLDKLPSTPVRIAKIRSREALPADFQGVPFETFLVCDNLYQGFLNTKNDDLLDEMATHLYPKGQNKWANILARSSALSQAERIGIFYWFASLKDYLSRNFKHFLRPMKSEGGNMFEQDKSLYEMLSQSVNAQIRALTKGDITKESEVLALDTWRALTELDAQAREYEELNKKYPSK